MFYSFKTSLRWERQLKKGAISCCRENAVFSQNFHKDLLCSHQSWKEWLENSCITMHAMYTWIGLTTIWRNPHLLVNLLSMTLLPCAYVQVSVRRGEEGGGREKLKSPTWEMAICVHGDIWYSLDIWYLPRKRQYTNGCNHTEGNRWQWIMIWMGLEGEERYRGSDLAGKSEESSL